MAQIPSRTGFGGEAGDGDLFGEIVEVATLVSNPLILLWKSGII